MNTLTGHGPFYHASDVVFVPGQRVKTAAELNPADPAAAQAHPVVDGSSDPQAVFVTEWPVDARRFGGTVYLVQVDGAARAWQDPNGSEDDWAVHGTVTVAAVHWKGAHDDH